MKKLNKLEQIILVIMCFAGFGNTMNAQTISDHYFGENAWMPDTIGNANACAEPPCVLYGKLHKQWGNIKNSNASLIRFGGIAADKNMPTNHQYIRMIDSVRANGMEPIIQVPFNNYHYTAQQAAQIVENLNIIQGRHVKYWIIGNEPDLGYSFKTSAQIANYIRPFASAMKDVDPSIIIIGPECAWYNSGIINGLTTPNGPDDITGKDAKGRYYIDVISFHTYPFNGTQSRADVLTKLTAPNSLEANLIALNARVAACNTAHGRGGASMLRTAITEANINWQNSPSDNLYGVGANSFIGGQFVAEMMCIGLKQGLDFINIWSVVEGNTTETNIGYIDPATNKMKPSYHHYKLLAQNFKGAFANCSSNQSSVKSFGSKSNQSISVLIMNQDLATNFNYRVRLNTTAITGTDALKINVNADMAVEYSDVINNQSTVLLTFDAAGNLTNKYEYSLTGHAIAGLAPTAMNDFATNVAPETRPNSGFEMKVFPNPSKGKFIVRLNLPNTLEKAYDVRVINLLGQEVFHKNLSFLTGKEEIDMSESFASGIYVMQVKEGDFVKNQKILLEK